MFVIAQGSVFTTAAFKSWLDNATPESPHCWRLGWSFLLQVVVVLVLGMTTVLFIIIIYFILGIWGIVW